MPDHEDADETELDVHPVREVTADQINAARSAVIAEHGPWRSNNIRLGEGVYTMSPDLVGLAELRVQRILRLVTDIMMSADLTGLRVLDLGSFESGFSIELAMHGAQVTAIEGRESHVAKARFVKEVLGLSDLDIRLGDLREIERMEPNSFDVVLCLGVLYHLDAPDVFQVVESLANVCPRVAIVETQIGLRADRQERYGERQYSGRSYEEDISKAGASLDNPRSFWPTRASLLNVLADAGFTSVAECLNPVIPQLAEFRDHVTFVATKGPAIVPLTWPTNEPVPDGRWPERQRQIAHPSQGWLHAARDRVERRRRRGLSGAFTKWRSDG